MRQEKAAEEEEGEGPRPKAKAKAKGRPKAKGKAKAKAQSKPKAKSKAKASPEPTADGTVGATADAGEAETNDEVSGKAVPSEPIHEDCAPSKATSEKVQASVEKGAPSEAVAEKSGPLEADPEKDEPAVDPQMGCSKVDPTGQPSNPASSKARSAKANVDGKDVSSKARLARAKSSANLPEEEEAKKPAPTKRRRVKETPETTDGLKDLPVEPQGDKNSTPKPMEPLDSKMGEKCSEVADPAEVGKKRARKSEDGSGKNANLGLSPQRREFSTVARQPRRKRKMAPVLLLSLMPLPGRSREAKPLQKGTGQTQYLELPSGMASRRHLTKSFAPMWMAPTLLTRTLISISNMSYRIAWAMRCLIHSACLGHCLMDVDCFLALH